MTAFFHSATLFATPPNGSHDEEVNVTTGKEFEMAEHPEIAHDFDRAYWVKHYAHPAMPQTAFYDRISGWVAPGGTLLIVGHLHTDSTGTGHHDGHAHRGGPAPAEASVGLGDVTARLDDARWEIDAAEEHVRTLTGPDGLPVSLHDVVVSAVRRR
jgi:hypothetical protein